jgi:uncharacterized membrane protein
VKWYAALLMICVCLTLQLGCQNRSSPGGPGASGSNSGSNNPLAGTADNTFKITTPPTSTSLAQGEKKDVTIGISRGKNFDQDVKLVVSGAPEGVKLDPSTTTLKAGSSESHVAVEASKGAALGEHTITVKATPTREGPDTSTTFTINVKKGG